MPSLYRCRPVVKSCIFWVLEKNGMFIAATGSDWGPSHFPFDDPLVASRFDTPGEARRWADAPGQGWTDYEPVRMRLTTRMERV